MVWRNYYYVIMDMMDAVFAIGGLVVIARAEKISRLEKEITEAHPWTRVTGWAGTRKGVLAWRFAGVLIMLIPIMDVIRHYLA